MSAIVAGEPVALVPLSNAGVVEVEAELFDRGALPVPECVAVRGGEASQLLVALEAVGAEKVSVIQTVNKNALSHPNLSGFIQNISNVIIVNVNINEVV